MNKVFIWILTFLLTSCVSMERIYPEFIRPRYTILGAVVPNDTLSIRVVKSMSAFDPITDSTIIYSGIESIVSYCINGGSDHQMYHNKNGIFCSDYILKEGDIVKLNIRDIEDETPPATAETCVLSPPKYTIEPTGITHQTRTPDANNKERLTINTTSNYIVNIFDDPDTEDYYMLCINGLTFYGSTITVTPFINANIRATPQALPFMDINIEAPLHGFAPGYSGVISDKEFNGETLEFNLNVQNYEYYDGKILKSNSNANTGEEKFYKLYKNFDEGNGYFYFECIPTGYIASFIALTIAKIDKSTYLYSKSSQYLLSNQYANGIFGEPDYIYSNVNDGYGILGSISPGNIEYFTKEGNKVDSLIYLRNGEEITFNVKELGIDGEWCISNYSSQDYYVDMDAADSVKLEIKGDHYAYFRKANKLKMWEVGPKKKTNVLFGSPIYIKPEFGNMYNYHDGLKVNILDDSNISIRPNISLDTHPPFTCYIEFSTSNGDTRNLGLIFE